jgi:hypothetical protein
LKSLETQQYFVDLREQNIKSMFSIPESIAKYQEAITKTNSRIDYATAVGLYMIPSDLVLKADTLIGYNNSIVIATADMKIGQNDDLNTDSFALSHSSAPAAAALLPIAAAAAMSTTIDPTYVGIGISLIAVLLFYAAS